MTTAQKINLLGYTKEDLTAYFTQIGEKSFRAAQVVKWIHQLRTTDFSLMTNLSLSLRQYLSEHANVIAPQIMQHVVSRDGTQKWLLQLEDNTVIETVYIPEADRGTLCISTQVGCAMNCAFCATGKLGFTRDLTSAEIIGQVWLAIHQLSEDKTNKDHVITNVVIMGMGEPLLNFEAVSEALSIMRDEFGYALPRRRVTVSTSQVAAAHPYERA